eukprot:1692516-Amphidinium_carterae.1
MFTSEERVREKGANAVADALTYPKHARNLMGSGSLKRALTALAAEPKELDNEEEWYIPSVFIIACKRGKHRSLGLALIIAESMTRQGFVQPNEITIYRDGQKDEVSAARLKASITGFRNDRPVTMGSVVSLEEEGHRYYVQLPAPGEAGILASLIGLTTKFAHKTGVTHRIGYCCSEDGRVFTAAVPLSDIIEETAFFKHVLEASE